VVSGDRQSCVVAQQPDDVQVGHPRLDHDDIGPLRLVGPQLSQRLPVIRRVLLVRLLVLGNNSA
jgi:hypothetical protein